MTHPGGRPRKLTPEQESRVYAEVIATFRGRRLFTYSRLARELRVGISTLERVMTRHRARVCAMAHPETSPPGGYPAGGCIPIAERGAS